VAAIDVDSGGRYLHARNTLSLCDGLSYGLNDVIDMDHDTFAHAHIGRAAMANNGWFAAVITGINYTNHAPNSARAYIQAKVMIGGLFAHAGSIPLTLMNWQSGKPEREPFTIYCLPCVCL
jgi:hypothetical protein